MKAKEEAQKKSSDLVLLKEDDVRKAAVVTFRKIADEHLAANPEESKQTAESKEETKGEAPAGEAVEEESKGPVAATPNDQPEIISTSDANKQDQVEVRPAQDRYRYTMLRTDAPCILKAPSEFEKVNQIMPTSILIANDVEPEKIATFAVPDLISLHAALTEVYGNLERENEFVDKIKKAIEDEWYGLQAQLRSEANKIRSKHNGTSVLEPLGKDDCRPFIAKFDQVMVEHRRKEIEKNNHLATLFKEKKGA